MTDSLLSINVNDFCYIYSPGSTGATAAWATWDLRAGRQPPPPLVTPVDLNPIGNVEL